MKIKENRSIYKIQPEVETAKAIIQGVKMKMLHQAKVEEETNPEAELEEAVAPLVR